MLKESGVSVDSANIAEKIKIDVKTSELRFGIDRKQENADVLEYIRTGDETIFENIYRRRIPTIEYLARQYQWLSDSPTSEIKIVFIKTVREYGKNGKKTDFNTFFYSSVKNHFVNSIKRKYRKKRTTSDGCDPLNRTVPLDEFIKDDEDSSTLHEFVASEDTRNEDMMHFDDCVELMSEGNELLSLVIRSFNGLTRNQIMREKLSVQFVAPVVSGDVTEDVYFAAGVSRDCFEIVGTTIEDGRIHSELKINSRNVVDLLCERMKNKKQIYDEIRG